MADTYKPTEGMATAAKRAREGKDLELVARLFVGVDG